MSNRNLAYDQEAWRQALAAFYRAEAFFQSAENVARGTPFTPADRRTIEALKAAFAVAA